MPLYTALVFIKKSPEPVTVERFMAVVTQEGDETLAQLVSRELVKVEDNIITLTDGVPKLFAKIKPNTHKSV